MARQPPFVPPADVEEEERRALKVVLTHSLTHSPRKEKRGELKLYLPGIRGMDRR